MDKDPPTPGTEVPLSVQGAAPSPGFCRGQGQRAAGLLTQPGHPPKQPRVQPWARATWPAGPQDTRHRDRDP